MTIYILCGVWNKSGNLLERIFVANLKVNLNLHKSTKTENIIEMTVCRMPTDVIGELLFLHRQ